MYEGHLSKALEASLEAIERVAGGDEQQPRTTQTGFKDLDDLMSGFHPGEFVVIGSRAGEGKSAFCLNLAYNLARQGVPILIFAVEMYAEQIAQRQLSAVAGISLTKIRTGRLSHRDRELLGHARQEIARLPLFVNDTSSLTLQALENDANSFTGEKKRHAVILVDYLELLSDEVDDWGSVSAKSPEGCGRFLKLLAKQLEAPIVAVSQLPVPLAESCGKQPELGDFTSSELVEHADAVIILYDAFSAMPVHEVTDPGKLKAREIEVIVAKHRTGPTGKLKLLLELKCMRFRNIAGVPPPGSEVSGY